MSSSHSAGRAIRHVRGLSLVEILFSLALVGIIVLAMLGVIMTGLSSIRQGNHTVAASNLAAEQIDRVRAMDFPLVPSGRTFDGRTNGPRDPSYPDFPPPPYPTKKIENSDYQIMVATSPLPSTASRLLRVDVTVFWRDQDAVGFGEGSAAFRERSLTLTSVASYGNQ